MSRSNVKRKSKSPVRRNLLPIWIMLAGLFLIAAAAFAFWRNNQPASASIQVRGEPRLVVDTEKIDHGNVKLGTVIRDQVKVTNVGDQTLLFTEKPFIQVLEGC